MKEEVLKQYFKNEIGAEDLNSDVEGSTIKTGFDTNNTYIKPIESNHEYKVKTEMDKH